MDTAAVSLIAFAMVLWATFAAIGGIFDRTETGVQAFEATRAQLYRSADTSVDVVDVDTSVGLLVTHVDVTIANAGQRSYSTVEMAEWDVVIDYVPVGGLERRIARLGYSDVLADDTWVVRDIYLDHESAQGELLGPGIFDPHEQLVMRMQVSPLIDLGTDGRVVIYIPGAHLPLVSFFTFAP